MPKIPRLFKTVSALLIVAFLCQDLAFAASDIKEVDRFFSSKSSADLRQAKKLLPSLDPATSTIEDAWFSDVISSEARNLVFLIQDAHANPSGQLNLAETLNALFAQQSCPVFVEGSFGDNSLSEYRRFGTLAQRQRIARKYLQKGELNGEEYLDLTSAHDFKIIGAEHRDLYRRSLKNYKAVARQREHFKKYLGELKLTLETLKIHLTSPSLALFLETYQGYKSKKTPFTEYLVVLKAQAQTLGLPLSDFRNLRLALSIRNPKQFSKLNAEATLKEADTLEKLILDRLCATPEDRAFFDALEYHRYLSRLVELSITPEEYGEYGQLKTCRSLNRTLGFLNLEISKLGRYYERALFIEPGFQGVVKRAEEFYDLTLSRDQAFIKAVVASQARRSVLIAGGYHAPNLKSLLRSKNISYISLRPTVTQETNQGKYEKLLLNLDLPRQAASSTLSVHALRAPDLKSLSVTQTPSVLREIVQLGGKQKREGREWEARGKRQEARFVPAAARLSHLLLNRFAYMATAAIGSYGGFFHPQATFFFAVALMSNPHHQKLEKVFIASALAGASAVWLNQIFYLLPYKMPFWIASAGSSGLNGARLADGKPKISLASGADEIATYLISLGNKPVKVYERIDPDRETIVRFSEPMEFKSVWDLQTALLDPKFAIRVSGFKMNGQIVALVTRNGFHASLSRFLGGNIIRRVDGEGNELEGARLAEKHPFETVAITAAEHVSGAEIDKVRKVLIKIIPLIPAAHAKCVKSILLDYDDTHTNQMRELLGKLSAGGIGAPENADRILASMDPNGGHDVVSAGNIRLGRVATDTSLGFEFIAHETAHALAASNSEVKKIWHQETGQWLVDSRIRIWLMGIFVFSLAVCAVLTLTVSEWFHFANFLPLAGIVSLFLEDRANARQWNEKAGNENDFVSPYASTNASEDFAESYAHYAVERPRFFLRAKNNPNLMKKYEAMQIIFGHKHAEIGARLADDHSLWRAATDLRNGARLTQSKPKKFRAGARLAEEGNNQFPFDFVWAGLEQRSPKSAKLWAPIIRMVDETGVNSTERLLDEAQPFLALLEIFVAHKLDPVLKKILFASLMQTDSRIRLPHFFKDGAAVYPQYPPMLYSPANHRLQIEGYGFLYHFNGFCGGLPQIDPILRPEAILLFFGWLAEMVAHEYGHIAWANYGILWKNDDVQRKTQAKRRELMDKHRLTSVHGRKIEQIEWDLDAEVYRNSLDKTDRIPENFGEAQHFTRLRWRYQRYLFSDLVFLAEMAVIFKKIGPVNRFNDLKVNQLRYMDKQQRQLFDDLLGYLEAYFDARVYDPAWFTKLAGARLVKSSVAEDQWPMILASAGPDERVLEYVLRSKAAINDISFIERAFHLFDIEVAIKVLEVIDHPRFILRALEATFGIGVENVISYLQRGYPGEYLHLIAPAIRGYLNSDLHTLSRLDLWELPEMRALLSKKIPFKYFAAYLHAVGLMGYEDVDDLIKMGLRYEDLERPSVLKTAPDEAKGLFGPSDIRSESIFKWEDPGRANVLAVDRHPGREFLFSMKMQPEEALLVDRPKHLPDSLAFIYGYEKNGDRVLLNIQSETVFKLPSRLRRRHKDWAQTLIHAIEQEFKKDPRVQRIVIPATVTVMDKWPSLSPELAFRVYTKAPWELGYELKVEKHYLDGTETQNQLVWVKEVGGILSGSAARLAYSKEENAARQLIAAAIEANLAHLQRYQERAQFYPDVMAGIGRALDEGRLGVLKRAQNIQERLNDELKHYEQIRAGLAEQSRKLLSSARLADPAKPELQRVRVIGIQDQKPIVWSLPVPLKKPLERLYAWPADAKKNHKAVEELFVGGPSVQNPFEQNPSLAIWTLLYYSDHFTDRRQAYRNQQIRIQALRFLDALNDSPAFKEFGEHREWIWPLVVSLVAAEYRIYQRDTGKMDDEHLKFLENAYRLLLDHLKNRYRGSEKAKNAYVDLALLQIINQSPELGNFLFKSRFYSHWDEMLQKAAWLRLQLAEGRTQLEPELSAPDGKGITADQQWRKALHEKIHHIQAALKRDLRTNQSARAAWDDPMDYLIRKAKVSKLVVFHNWFSVYYKKPAEDELSSALKFQLRWLDQMGQVGYKEWAFNNRLNGVFEAVAAWRAFERDKTTAGDLAKKIEIFLNQNGDVSIQEELQFSPGSRQIEAKRALLFLNELRRIRQKNRATIKLFQHGKAVDESSSFAPWLESRKETKALVFGVDTDPALEKYMPDAFCVEHLPMEASYSDDSFLPAKAISHATYNVKKDSQGEWNSGTTVALQIHHNLAILGLFFHAPLLEHKADFLTRFGLFGGESRRLVDALVYTTDPDTDPAESEIFDLDEDEPILVGGGGGSEFGAFGARLAEKSFSIGKDGRVVVSGSWPHKVHKETFANGLITVYTIQTAEKAVLRIHDDRREPEGVVRAVLSYGSKVVAGFDRLESIRLNVDGNMTQFVLTDSADRKIYLNAFGIEKIEIFKDDDASKISETRYFQPVGGFSAIKRVADAKGKTVKLFDYDNEGTVRKVSGVNIAGGIEGSLWKISQEIGEIHRRHHAQRKPTLVNVIGEEASGKGTFARLLSEATKEKTPVTVIPVDSWMLDRYSGRRPTGIYLDKLELLGPTGYSHSIERLAQGREIFIPIFDSNLRKRETATESLLTEARQSRPLKRQGRKIWRIPSETAQAIAALLEKKHRRHFKAGRLYVDSLTGDLLERVLPGRGLVIVEGVLTRHDPVVARHFSKMIYVESSQSSRLLHAYYRYIKEGRHEDFPPEKIVSEFVERSDEEGKPYIKPAIGDADWIVDNRFTFSKPYLRFIYRLPFETQNSALLEAAVRVLGETDEPEAIEALVRIIKLHPDAKIRELAVRMLNARAKPNLKSDFEEEFHEMPAMPGVGLTRMPQGNLNAYGFETENATATVRVSYAQDERHITQVSLRAWEGEDRLPDQKLVTIIDAGAALALFFAPSEKFGRVKVTLIIRDEPFGSIEAFAGGAKGSYSILDWEMIPLSVALQRDIRFAKCLNLHPKQLILEYQKMDEVVWDAAARQAWLADATAKIADDFLEPELGHLMEALADYFWALDRLLGFTGRERMARELAELGAQHVVDVGGIGRFMQDNQSEMVGMSFERIAAIWAYLIVHQLENFFLIRPFIDESTQGEKRWDPRFSLGSSFYEELQIASVMLAAIMQLQKDERNSQTAEIIERIRHAGNHIYNVVTFNQVMDISRASAQLGGARLAEYPRSVEIDWSDGLYELPSSLLGGLALNIERALPDVMVDFESNGKRIRPSEALGGLGVGKGQTLHAFITAMDETEANLVWGFFREAVKTIRFFENRRQGDAAVAYEAEDVYENDAWKGMLSRLERMRVQRGHGARLVSTYVDRLYERAGIERAKGDYTEKGFFARSHAKMFAKAIEALDVPLMDAPRILELGSGQGENMIRFARQFPESKIIGIESEEKLFEDSQNLIRAAAEQELLDRANVDTLSGDFNGERFEREFELADIVYYFAYGTKNVKALAQTLDRWLRPNAKIVMVGLDDGLIDLLRQRGFNVHKTYGDPIFSVWLLQRSPIISGRPFLQKASELFQYVLSTFVLLPFGLTLLSVADWSHRVSRKIRGARLAEQKFYEQVAVFRGGGTIEMAGAEGRRNADSVGGLLAPHADKIGAAKKMFEPLPDSSNIGPSEWNVILADIKALLLERQRIQKSFTSQGKALAAPGGLLVTVGTDTVEQIGLVLALELTPFLNVPIILTAAARPPTEADSDAQNNVDHAFSLLTSQDLPPGVYFFYNDKLHLASRIKKVVASHPRGQTSAALHEANDDFESYGEIVGSFNAAGNFILNRAQIISPKPTQAQSIDAGNIDFGVVEHLVVDDKTPALVFEDAAKRLLALKADGHRTGLIIQGRAAHNSEAVAIAAVLETLREAQIPVLVGAPRNLNSWGSNGRVMLLPKYLTFEKARTKLSWLLAKGVSYADVENEMNQDKAGEVPSLQKFPDSHIYDAPAVNDFKAGKEVVVVYPGLKVKVIRDAVRRLGDKGRRSLLIYGFGDGNLPLGSLSLRQRVAGWLQSPENNFPKALQADPEGADLESIEKWLEKTLRTLLPADQEKIQKQYVLKAGMTEYSFSIHKQLARRLIKDALMASHPFLNTLGQAVDNGVRVHIRSVAHRSYTNTRLYELGTMLMAVGVASQQADGWHMVFKPQAARLAEGSDGESEIERVLAGIYGRAKSEREPDRIPETLDEMIAPYQSEIGGESGALWVEARKEIEGLSKTGKAAQRASVDAYLRSAYKRRQIVNLASLAQKAREAINHALQLDILPVSASAEGAETALEEGYKSIRAEAEENISKIRALNRAFVARVEDKIEQLRRLATHRDNVEAVWEGAEEIIADHAAVMTALKAFDDQIASFEADTQIRKELEKRRLMEVDIRAKSDERLSRVQELMRFREREMQVVSPAVKPDLRGLSSTARQLAGMSDDELGGFLRELISPKKDAASALLRAQAPIFSGITSNRLLLTMFIYRCEWQMGGLPSGFARHYQQINPDKPTYDPGAKMDPRFLSSDSRYQTFLNELEYRFRTLAYSPDKRIAVLRYFEGADRLSLKRRVKIVDAKTGEDFEKKIGDELQVKRVSFSPDGSLMWINASPKADEPVTKAAPPARDMASIVERMKKPTGGASSVTAKKNPFEDDYKIDTLLAMRPSIGRSEEPVTLSPDKNFIVLNAWFQDAADPSKRQIRFIHQETGVDISRLAAGEGDILSVRFFSHLSKAKIEVRRPNGVVENVFPDLTKLHDDVLASFGARLASVEADSGNILRRVVAIRHTLDKPGAPGEVGAGEAIEFHGQVVKRIQARNPEIEVFLGNLTREIPLKPILQPLDAAMLKIEKGDIIEVVVMGGDAKARERALNEVIYFFEHPFFEKLGPAFNREGDEHMPAAGDPANGAELADRLTLLRDANVPPPSKPTTFVDFIWRELWIRDLPHENRSLFLILLVELRRSANVPLRFSSKFAKFAYGVSGPAVIRYFYSRGMLAAHKKSEVPYIHFHRDLNLQQAAILNLVRSAVDLPGPDKWRVLTDAAEAFRDFLNIAPESCRLVFQALGKTKWTKVYLYLYNAISVVPEDLPRRTLKLLISTIIAHSSLEVPVEPQDIPSDAEALVIKGYEEAPIVTYYFKGTEGAPLMVMTPPHGKHALSLREIARFYRDNYGYHVVVIQPRASAESGGAFSMRGILEGQDMIDVIKGIIFKKPGIDRNRIYGHSYSNTARHYACASAYGQVFAGVFLDLTHSKLFGDETENGQSNWTDFFLKMPEILRTDVVKLAREMMAVYLNGLGWAVSTEDFLPPLEAITSIQAPLLLRSLETDDSDLIVKLKAGRQNPADIYLTRRFVKTAETAQMLDMDQRNRVIDLANLPEFFAAAPVKEAPKSASKSAARLAVATRVSQVVTIRNTLDREKSVGYYGVLESQLFETVVLRPIFKEYKPAYPGLQIHMKNLTPLDGDLGKEENVENALDVQVVGMHMDDAIEVSVQGVGEEKDRDKILHDVVSFLRHPYYPELGRCYVMPEEKHPYDDLSVKTVSELVQLFKVWMQRTSPLPPGDRDQNIIMILEHEGDPIVFERAIHRLTKIPPANQNLIGISAEALHRYFIAESVVSSENTFVGFNRAQAQELFEASAQSLRENQQEDAVLQFSRYLDVDAETKRFLKRIFRDRAPEAIDRLLSNQKGKLFSRKEIRAILPLALAFLALKPTRPVAHMPISLKPLVVAGENKRQTLLYEFVGAGLPAATKTVLLVPDHGQRAFRFWTQARLLAKAGQRVFILERPAHGEALGTFATNGVLESLHIYDVLKRFPGIEIKNMSTEKERALNDLFSGEIDSGSWEKLFGEVDYKYAQNTFLYARKIRARYLKENENKQTGARLVIPSSIAKEFVRRVVDAQNRGGWLPFDGVILRVNEAGRRMDRATVVGAGFNLSGFQQDLNRQWKNGELGLADLREAGIALDQAVLVEWNLDALDSPEFDVLTAPMLAVEISRLSRHALAKHSKILLSGKNAARLSVYVLPKDFVFFDSASLPAEFLALNPCRVQIGDDSLKTEAGSRVLRLARAKRGDVQPIRGILQGALLEGKIPHEEFVRSSKPARLFLRHFETLLGRSLSDEEETQLLKMSLGNALLRSLLVPPVATLPVNAILRGACLALGMIRASA